MATLTIGLTGGLASGKSTLAAWFAEAGCSVLDADEVVADLYRPGEPGAVAVAEQLGPGFLRQDGSVDRDKVAARVFSDRPALVRLEEVIHPLVRDHVRGWMETQPGLAVVEATLMLESGLAAELDLVIAVSAEETLRSMRAASRGLTMQQVESRLAAQNDDAFREASADVVIRNNGSLDDFRRRADELIASLQQRVVDADQLDDETT